MTDKLIVIDYPDGSRRLVRDLTDAELRGFVVAIHEGLTSRNGHVMSPETDADFLAAVETELEIRGTGGRQ